MLASQIIGYLNSYISMHGDKPLKVSSYLLDNEHCFFDPTLTVIGADIFDSDPDADPEAEVVKQVYVITDEPVDDDYMKIITTGQLEAVLESFMNLDGDKDVFLHSKYFKDGANLGDLDTGGMSDIVISKDNLSMEMTMFADFHFADSHEVFGKKTGGDKFQFLP